MNDKPGQIIRVERLSHAQMQDLQRQRDHLSFDVRELKNFEKGVITRVYSRSRYDVLVPGRSDPYEWIPAMEPAHLKLGQVVTIGFVGGNPGIPVILVRQQEKRPRLFLGPLSAPSVISSNWTHRRQGPGRTSVAAWTEVALTRIRSISKTWESDVPDVRVWNGEIYLVLSLGSVLRLSPGDYYPEFYDSETDEYIPDSYSLESATRADLGYTLYDLLLDKNEDGNMLLTWYAGVSKASRADLATLWATPVESPDLLIVGSVLAAGGVYGCLIVNDSRLYLRTFSSATGTVIDTILLEQTAEPEGGFLEGEDVALLSGGTYDPSLWADNFLTYWDPASPPTRSGYYGLLNPWGFTNGSTSGIDSKFFAQYIGERRYGGIITSKNSRHPYWGEVPGPKGVLHFSALDGVLEENGTFVPRPPASQYFPTLAAYSMPTGARKWEVLGWEATPDEAPFHYRDLYSPRMVRDGKLFVVALRLTFETIDEEFVDLDCLTGSWNNIPSSPDYNPALDVGDPAVLYGDIGWYPSRSVRTNEYVVAGMTPKRSRRTVGIQTFFELYDLETGALLASQSLVPQITSSFPTRGDYKGLLPPEHGIEVSGLNPNTTDNHDIAKSVFGYDTTAYWPAPSSYFEQLEAGNFYAYGLYASGLTSNPSFRVTPVWPPSTGKPGLELDVLEGDEHWDPLSNGGYNRIRLIPPAQGATHTVPSGPGAGSTIATWGALGDVNNNANWDTYDALPPPSAYLYDAVFHETHWDMPHVSDYFNPLSNSDGSLIIFPPLYELGPDPTDVSGTGGIGTSDPLAGKKFAFAAGSNDHYSWSGGTVDNRMAHTIVATHANWQTRERQVWEARDLAGNVAWTHIIEGSEIGVVSRHSFSRPCCADGEMRLNYRVNKGPIRLRVINDQTGELISDTESGLIEPNLAEGDNGGHPHETIMAGDVSVLLTRADEAFNFDTFEFSVVGQPHVHGMYPEEPAP